MSYDPSHRKPPRQERWPQATPPEGWPSAGYPRQAGHQRASGGSPDRGYRSAVATDAFAPAGNGYGDAGNGYGDAGNGYGDARNGYGDAGNGYGTGGHRVSGYRAGGYASGHGYAGQTNGYAGAAGDIAGTADDFAGTAGDFAGAADDFAGAADGYGSSRNGYGRATDEYAGATSSYDWNGYDSSADGYAGGRHDFAGSTAYLGPGSYIEPAPSGPMLVAPDAGVYPDSWQADQERRREAGRRGLIVGAVTGFLAAAVAIGVSTLAAAFIRPQASPMMAMGGVFIHRAPSALKHVAVQHFGANGRTVLLLGMYVIIAVLAMAVGVLSRRATALGVAGIAAFSLVGAFVTITRPGSRVTDLVPSVIGGIASVAALIWLARASAPVAPVRRAHSGGRRRTR